MGYPMDIQISLRFPICIFVLVSQKSKIQGIFPKEWLGDWVCRHGCRGLKVHHFPDAWCHGKGQVLRWPMVILEWLEYPLVINRGKGKSFVYGGCYGKIIYKFINCRFSMETLSGTPCWLIGMCLFVFYLQLWKIGTAVGVCRSIYLARVVRDLELTAE